MPQPSRWQWNDAVRHHACRHAYGKKGWCAETNFHPKSHQASANSRNETAAGRHDAVWVSFYVLPTRPFCIAKRPVSGRETARFALRNGPFCEAADCQAVATRPETTAGQPRGCPPTPRAKAAALAMLPPAPRPGPHPARRPAFCPKTRRGSIFAAKRCAIRQGFLNFAA